MPSSRMEATYDSMVQQLPFSHIFGEDIDSAQEIERLRIRLIEVTNKQIRQKWRSAVGFTLAHHYRTQLLSLLEKKDKLPSLPTDCDKTNSIDGRALSKNGSSASELQRDCELGSLRRQLQQQICLTETVKNAAEQEINYLKSLLAAESGNYASAVNVLNERHHEIQQRLADELDRTRQTLISLMERYTVFKKRLPLMESQIAELVQRDATNRQALSRLVNRLVHLSSQKQVLLDRLGELESRLAWSMPDTTTPTQQHFAFDQLSMTKKHTDGSNTVSAGLEFRVTELQQRLSGLEQQLDQVQNSSESLAHRVYESQKIKTMIDASCSPVVARSTVNRIDHPLNPVAIPGSRIPIIDSSEASSPEPSSSIPDEIICNGPNLPLDTDSGKAAEHLDNSPSTVSRPTTVCSQSNHGLGAERPQPTRHGTNVAGRSNRAVLTGLCQARAPRFCRLEMRTEVEPVRALLSPVIYHHPSSTVCSHSDPLGVHSIFSVASVQPKVIRHKRYERVVPGSRAPYSTVESDDPTLDESTEPECDTAAVVRPESPHPAPLLGAVSVAPPTESVERPAAIIATSTYHPRLSKLGSVLKSIKRSNKVERPPVAELSDPI